MLHDDQHRRRFLQKQLARPRPLAQAPRCHRGFSSHQMSCPGEGKPDSAVGRGRGGQGMGVKTPPSPGRGAGNRGGRRGREGEAPSPVQSLAQPVLRCVLVNSFLAEGRTEQPFLLLSPQPCCNGRQTRREKSQRERLNPFPTGLKPVICILQQETFPASSRRLLHQLPSPLHRLTPLLPLEPRNSRLGPRIQLSTGEAERGPAFTSWNTALCQEEAKVGFFFLFSA